MKHTTIITPIKPWAKVIQEWWDYKEVFVLLGWRDIILQYRQTVVGVLWVLLRPLLTVAVFTIVFNKIAGFSSGDTPYVLVVFSGMLVWQFFADMFAYGSNSFLANVSLISKVYFPRVMLPASRLLCSTVDFAVTFFAYLAVSWIKYGMLPALTHVLVLPFMFVWLVGLSLAMALFFGSLVVRFRDFKHVVPFMIQLGFYATPVAFSLSMIPKEYYWIIALNPLAGVIHGFRYALLGESLEFIVMFISLTVTCALMALALVYFKVSERLFADFI